MEDTDEIRISRGFNPKKKRKIQPRFKIIDGIRITRPFILRKKIKIMPPHPKIMDEMCKFLKENGHICTSIIGIKDHKFEWCQRDICEKENMRKINNKKKKFAKELEEKGHTCISYTESFPVEIGWCQQEICKNLIPE